MEGLTRLQRGSESTTRQTGFFMQGGPGKAHFPQILGQRLAFTGSEQWDGSQRISSSTWQDTSVCVPAIVEISYNIQNKT